MDRVATFVGVLGLAVAAGALLAGNLILVPGLTGEHALLDENQAISVAAPLHLRCAEFVLVASIVMALAIPRWLGSRGATTVALLAVGAAALDRVVLLPKVYEAWAKVDLVAGRPQVRLAEAQQVAGQSGWLELGLAALLVAVAGFVALRRHPWRPAPRDTAAPPLQDDYRTQTSTSLMPQASLSAP